MRSVISSVFSLIQQIFQANYQSLHVVRQCVGLEENTFLPEQWGGITFHLRWRGALLSVRVTQNQLTVRNLEGASAEFYVGGTLHTLAAGAEQTFSHV